MKSFKKLVFTQMQVSFMGERNKKETKKFGYIFERRGEEISVEYR